MTAALALVVVAVLAWPYPGRGPDEHGRGPAASEVVRRRRLFPWQAWHPRRGDDAWVADFADVVAVGLDAGLELGRAVLTAARSPTVARRAPWLEDEVARAVREGEPVADMLARLVAGELSTGAVGPVPNRATGPLLPGRAVGGSAGTELGVLIRAWRLSEHVGAAASTTTAAAAAALRARGADRERARALAAGPRASMWLLTALPLAGPLVGMAVGVGPGRLYASTPARLVAVVGLVLTLAGWAWARRVLRRAGRPATTASTAR